MPTGARIGFLNLQVVVSESNAGKQGQERWRVLNDKLFAGLAARNKEIQGLTLFSVEPGLDLSAEVVKRLNAAKRP